MSKRGAPSKYKPEHCDKLAKVAAEGGGQAQMCLAIGVKSENTFRAWLDTYPEFKEAYKHAQLVSKAYYSDLLLKGATGQIDKFNFKAIEMIMCNMFPEDYSKGQQTGSKTEINIGSINQIKDMSPEKIQQRLESKLQQLRQIEGVTLDGIVEKGSK